MQHDSCHSNISSIATFQDKNTRKLTPLCTFACLIMKVYMLKEFKDLLYSFILNDRFLSWLKIIADMQTKKVLPSGTAGNEAFW